MSILRQTAANDNSAARKTFETVVAAIVGAIDRCELDDQPFDAIERLLLEATNEGVRRQVQQRLQRIADSFGDFVRIARVQATSTRHGSLLQFVWCDRHQALDVPNH
jgi:predicted metal-dependent hydrolase